MFGNDRNSSLQMDFSHGIGDFNGIAASVLQAEREKKKLHTHTHTMTDTALAILHMYVCMSEFSSIDHHLLFGANSGKMWLAGSLALLLCFLSSVPYGIMRL